ncbi:hypothetical protein J6590_016174 [Homalodisca vitripennis]|nr:hypothetical protein J6590_016174 [Homalodisca vitripennis]
MPPSHGTNHCKKSNGTRAPKRKRDSEATRSDGIMKVASPLQGTHTGGARVCIVYWRQLQGDWRPVGSECGNKHAPHPPPLHTGTRTEENSQP